MNLINCMIVLFLTRFVIIAAPPVDVVFIIQNQETKYHSELSQELKKNIIKQSLELHKSYRIRVHILHEILNHPGGWTIHNLIPQLLLLPEKNGIGTYTNRNKFMDKKIINDNTRWIIFCEDKTRVRLKSLMERLNYENHMQPLYLGYALYDREATIIHHFSFFENPKWFPYPMLRAGVVLSLPLLKSIAEIYANEKNKLFKQHFSIDAGHELASFIYDNIQIPMTSSKITQEKYQHCQHLTSSHATANVEAGDAVQNKMLRTTTSSRRPIVNNDVTANVFDLAHSDYRYMSTNEIRVQHDNTSTCTTAKTRTSIIKKEKIILTKASYICSMATWDNTSIGSSSNINANDCRKSCAMYAASSESCTPVRSEEIYFAVKTCSKYHNDRLPIIQATWARYVKHIKYFSDIQDNRIPTTYSGVPNVEMGHCAKTLQVLKLALYDIDKYNNKQHNLRRIKEARQEKNIHIKWLFLSDDDTLLSVSGVCEVLGCYESNDEIYLGERYGYRLFAHDGFNYITGGGGIAFSLPVVKLILQHCSCPSASAPDDMILGSCLHSLQLKALHSPRFHQARPNDYPLELLKQEQPVSFHKYWQVDPLHVYKRWFAAQDNKLFSNKKLDCESHNIEDNHFKACNFLTKKEPLNLNNIPVSKVTSTYHHSKQCNVDL